MIETNLFALASEERNAIGHSRQSRLWRKNMLFEVIAELAHLIPTPNHERYQIHSKINLLTEFKHSTSFVSIISINR